MFLQKVTTFLLIFSLAIVTGGVVAEAQTNYEASQADDYVSNVCPINGTASAIFLHPQAEYQVNNDFSESVLLSNQTDYTLAGIRVGVAAYKDEISAAPAYWTVLPGVHQLMPGQSMELPVKINLSAMEAGEYLVDIFSIQGDETAVLGSIIRDGVSGSALKVVKSGTDTNDTEVSIEVNQLTAEGGLIKIDTTKPMVVEITTKNNNTTPLLNSQMVGVVTQGDIPLGAAVLTDKIDSVKLIPGGERVTELENNVMFGNVLTVYAGLLTEELFQPVTRVSVELSEDEFEGSWPYVSQIGVSNFETPSESEIVACVRYVGAYANSQSIHEPLGVDFAISTNGEELAAERVTSFDTDARNYFAYQPDSNAGNFTLTAGFLQKRFLDATNPELDNRTSEERVREGLIIVDEITLEFACTDLELCGNDAADTPIHSQDKSNDNQETFWFYAAVVIAAALLMYIMLRRLHPEDDEPTPETSPEELQ